MAQATNLGLSRMADASGVGYDTLVGTLSRADRQNSLAAALNEYGLLRRTIYATRYLAREDYRRKISRQLNKGESVHALRRDVFYAHEGAVAASSSRPTRRGV